MENEKIVPAGVKTEQEKFGDYNVTITKDYYGAIDPFYLSKKDPNFEYRFLREEHKNISIKTGNLLFQKGGWQICAKEHLLSLGIKERDLSPEGLLKRGDTILAYMPKKLYLEKQKQKQDKANEQIRSVKEIVTKGDRSLDGKIHPDMKGIQTKRDLKGNWK